MALLNNYEVGSIIIDVARGFGDYNGDGFSDLLFSTSFSHVFLILENGLGFDDSSIASLLSSGAGMVIGASNIVAPADYRVSWVGDINPDGKDEFMLSTPFAQSERGILYVIYGDDKVKYLDLDTMMSSGRGFMVIGVAPFDHVGYAISGVGDVDDDGCPDILIGSPDAAVDSREGVSHPPVPSRPRDAPDAYRGGASWAAGVWQPEGAADARGDAGARTR